MQPAPIHVQDDPTGDILGDQGVQAHDLTVSTVSYFVRYPSVKIKIS